MIAIDTNILVRILIDDESQPKQVKTARQFARKHPLLFISATVQVELIWVLEYCYKMSKPELIYALKHLNENETFILQNKSQFSTAVSLYESHAVDFSDCMIYAQASEEGIELTTFDKKFAKLPKVKRLLD